MGKYIDCVEVAKIVRKKLAEKFPGCNFSVKTDRYSGGSSIRVRWTDGPTTDEVNALVRVYHGSDFDPMTDLKSYHSSTDPDTGEQVRYGNDHIFCDREYSKEAMTYFWALVCDKFGYAHNAGTLKQSGSDWYYDFPTMHNDYRTELHNMSRVTSLYSKPAPTPVAIPTADGVKIGEYKGHPTITLMLANGNEFSFGIAKAQAILQHIESIRQFVGEKANEPV